MNKPMKPNRSTSLVSMLAAMLLALGMVGLAQGAQTVLSNAPLFSAFNVPANLMLALSVEFPTGTVAAYTDNKIPLVYKDSSGNIQTIACPGRNSSGFGDCYYAAMHYLGYFDFNKCYDYDATNNYFVPVNNSGPVCTGHWSGNMLNWATMTALDEFRQTLTGGYRVIDTTSTTVLQRSRQTAQGSASNFPTKQIGAGNPSGVGDMAPSDVIGDPVFTSAATIYIRSHNGGTELSNGTDRGVFLEVADNTSFVQSDDGTQNDKLFYARVQVCVSGMLESNCNSAHAAADYPGAGVYPKPDGLIQQNANRIRVGVDAYVFALGNSHPNGILRALLRDNGPTTYNGFGARQSNANAEWDAATGVFATNPDPDEATPSGVSMSGAINYLNQFGLVENGYETYDTISELYWAALAYYKNVPLDSSYTNGVSSLTKTQLDGFPAITPAQGIITDPIQYSCSGNNIVTIGDSHTWCDTAVPGSSLDAKDQSGSNCSNHTPLAALTANGTDPGLNTGSYVRALGNLPLIEAIGSTAASNTMAQYAGTSDLSTIFEFNGTRGDTYDMAGMAYYAHTQDIRSDDPAYLNPVSKVDSTLGKQTVDTYTVDVMEPGGYDGSSGREIYNPSGLGGGPGPNMYWLAAKYGGFDVDDSQCISPPQAPDGSGPIKCIKVNAVLTPTPESFLSWHTNLSSASAKNLRPDNYFPGNRPDLIHAGLATIFSRVASKNPISASGPGFSSSRVLSNVVAGATPFVSSVSGFPIYTTKYTPGDWSGDISGYVGASTPTGGVTPACSSPGVCSMPWSAQHLLDTLAQAANSATPPVVVGWDTGRRIVTWNGTKGVPFRWANLTATQQTALNSDSTLLDFLRGDRSNEGTKFHIRKHALGDIVDSQPVLVQGALSTTYSDAANPGYSAFATSVQNRTPVVYVGANDGMLHAFAGDFAQAGSNPPFVDASGNPVGGSELFAYVPSFVFNGPSTPATPQVDGLAALANLNGVTANPYAHHFYVDQTPQVADVDFDFTGGSTAGTTPQWHTLLVAGLNKGGDGYYALDVTSAPPAVDTTSSNTVEPNIANQVLWEFTDQNMGFTFGRPLITKTRAFGWVVILTSGYDNSATGQDGQGHLYVVNAKTGQLLTTFSTGVGSAASPSGLGQATCFIRDLSDGTCEQVYAGDLQGNVWRFDVSATSIANPGPAPTLFATLTDPSSAAQPITTAPRVEEDISSTGLGLRRWVFVGTGKFLDVSDLIDTQQQTMYALRDGSDVAPSTTGLPLTRNVLKVNNLTTNLNLTDSDHGWYYDLTGKAPGTGGATERIVTDPDAAAGVFEIAWATLTPTKDPCSYQGAIYAANFGTGITALLGLSGSPVTSIPVSHAVTKIQFVQLPDGTLRIIYGDTGQNVGTLTPSPVGGLTPLGRLNWREILN